MKTKDILLAVILAIFVCMPLAAQINVQADGGVRIGSRPIGGWTLTGKGLANAGLDYTSIDAGMLSPGMYTYSLSVNNRMVDTKRMVVME